MVLIQKKHFMEKRLIQANAMTQIDSLYSSERKYKQ